MPEGCIVCPFAERMPPGRTRCLITCRILAENYNAPSHNRQGFCPLVDLGNHGDLKEFIDVTTTVNEDDGTQEVNLGEAFAAYFKMREAPVVIEAEGAEE